jgi:hypothetical protein
MNGSAPARGSNGHVAVAERRGLLVVSPDDARELTEAMGEVVSAVGPLSLVDLPEPRARMGEFCVTLLVREDTKVKAGSVLARQLQRFRFEMQGKRRIVALPGWTERSSLRGYLNTHARLHPDFAEPEGFISWIEFLADWEPPTEPIGPGMPAQPREDDDFAEFDQWPNEPDACVYRGVLGDIVSEIQPNTEADPVGILIQALVGFGNLIGRTAHGRVEDTRHYLNEFAVLVGESSVGAKGTSGDRAMAILREIDATWADTRTTNGIPSGEGLIELVRDARHEKQPIREKGRVVDYQDVMVDEGVTDKRLLVFESEFGGLLRMLERQGNKLSSVIRQAFDGKRLQSPSKNRPLFATNAHVSILGHVTPTELIALLSNTEAANGFGNRFLWIAVRRTQDLPSGGKPLVLGKLAVKIDRCVTYAKSIHEMEWDDDAYELWASRYRALVAPPPGLIGTILSRGRAHVFRLAMLYSLLELDDRPAQRHRRISLTALEAAFALWDYAERSARFIFGEALGNRAAERILDAIRHAGDEGVSRSKIYELFKGRRPSREINRDLGLLLKHRLVRFERIETGGRPTEIWYEGGVERGKKGINPPATDEEAEQSGQDGQNGERQDGVSEGFPPFSPLFTPPPNGFSSDGRGAYYPERPSVPQRRECEGDDAQANPTKAPTFAHVATNGYPVANGHPSGGNASQANVDAQNEPR